MQKITPFQAAATSDRLGWVIAMLICGAIGALVGWIWGGEGAAVGAVLGAPIGYFLGIFLHGFWEGLSASQEKPQRSAL
jgi:hypothetical protein